MPRSAIPPIWENFGLCVGNNINTGGTQTIAGAQEDVDYHASIGLRHVRQAGMGFYWTNIQTGSGLAYGLRQQAIIESMIQMYLDAGINMQYVHQSGFDWLLYPQYEVAYAEYLAEEAAWAESLGITRFQIDNELEIRVSRTHQQVYDRLQSLVPIVRAAGFTGEITYSNFYDVADIWRTSGLGDFDDLGMDHYGINGSYVSLNNLAKSYWGENVYLSEWNVTNSGTIWDFNKQDPVWLKNQLVNYLNHIKVTFPNKVNYFFTWKNANDGPFDALSACTKDSGLKRLFWYAITGQRSPIVW